MVSTTICCACLSTAAFLLRQTICSLGRACGVAVSRRDYVDRGKQGIETFCLLIAYKIKYPEELLHIERQPRDRSDESHLRLLRRVQAAV